MALRAVVLHAVAHASRMICIDVEQMMEENEAFELDRIIVTESELNNIK